MPAGIVIGNIPLKSDWSYLTVPDLDPSDGKIQPIMMPSPEAEVSTLPPAIESSTEPSAESSADPSAEPSAEPSALISAEPSDPQAPPAAGFQIPNPGSSALPLNPQQLPQPSAPIIFTPYPGCLHN